MVSHYNYLFVTLLLYSVFNERLPPPSRQLRLATLVGHSLESRSALAAYALIGNVLASCDAGRPKWTRTTDLVLIRHAL